MSDTATTTKGKLSVGFAKWLGVAALVVLGGISIRGPINTITRLGGAPRGALLGTATGAVQQVNGVTVAFRDIIPLTMTGGKAGYNLASVRLKDYRISGSGMVTTAMLAWVKAPAGGTSDIGINKCQSGLSYTTIHAASGSVLPNGDNLTNSSGGLIGLSGSGAVRVPGHDCLVVKSLTNPTTSGSGYLIIEGREDPSE